MNAPDFRRLNKHQEQFFQNNNSGTIVLRPANRIVHPYSWTGHIPFAFVLTRIMKPEVVVELGTHSGNSFCAFCQAVKEEKLTTKSYAIDTWKGDNQAGYYNEDVYKDLAQYVNTSYGRFAKLLRMTFDEGLAFFDNGSIDLLHIDGMHTYEAVRHDYDAWKCKLSPSGVVLLHDTQVFDRQFGVHRLWDELRTEHQCFDFLHSHGLGILLVGDKIVPDLVEFINLATEDPDPIRLLFETASKLWLPEEARGYQQRFSRNRPSDAFHLSCELFLDLGKGFNDSEKLISFLQIESCKGFAAYDLTHFPDTLLGLRFDPGNSPICLHNIAAWGHNRERGWNKLKAVRSSALVSNERELLFGSDPWVEFEVPEFTINKLKVELQVKATGDALLESMFDLVKHYISIQVKLADDLKEKEAMAKKLWSDIAEKDRMLIEHKKMAIKLWSDLAEKDRLLGK